MFREFAARQSIFDLPSRKFFSDTGGRDISVVVHGHQASTPLGPAAGPHTQLAQNIVLSYLVGGRVIELKTVQEKDDLTIPRPCIDMKTVGYNVEWSQELTVPESLEEYVKAAMAIRILKASGSLRTPPELSNVLFELSLGYDLAGIQSEKVQAFLAGMTDASAIIDKLRDEIPEEFGQYRDLDFQTNLAAGVTLSTFHGCPPGDIEKIATFLMDVHGLPCTIKLNPTLLGKAELLRLLHDGLLYHDIEVPDEAFEKDAAFSDIAASAFRLQAFGKERGVGFGVKLTNTLVVKNRNTILPESVPEAYLSGPPLHVLAIRLAAKVKEALGASLPISFSAGIDALNFADVVALDFRPVTVCSDWLKPGGYGRASRYFEELFLRMDKASVANRRDWVIRGFGKEKASLLALGLDAEKERRCLLALETKESLEAAAGEDYSRWVTEAAAQNLQTYANTVLEGGRYDRAHHAKAPKKLGTKLHLFDCVTCDKCIPVCPNDANFALAIAHTEIPIVKMRQEAGAWIGRREGILRLDEKHQIGNYADHCNDCGNCDVFCPEDGGPYRIKPRFFGSETSFKEAKADGFYMERSRGRDLVLARLEGAEKRVEIVGDQVLYEAAGFRVSFAKNDPEGTIAGVAEGEVDLTHFRIVDVLRSAIFARGEVSFPSCLWENNE